MHLADSHAVLAATVISWVTDPDRNAEHARIVIVADVDPRNDEECMAVDRVLLAHAHRVAANLYERETCVGLAVDVGQPDRMRTTGVVRSTTHREEVFAIALEIEWVDRIDAELLEWHKAALEDTGRR